MYAGRNIRVLLNPKSGAAPPVAIANTLYAIHKYWDREGVNVSFQFSKDVQDGQQKARRAVEEGVDALLIAGGDGMVNSIGSILINTPVALGVIPTGSGNGFARHFDIAQNVNKAAESLVNAEAVSIDVGTANGTPFFVTCSMAWDAAIVKSFEKSPVRGVIPYLFAAAYEFFDYQPQNMKIEIDGKGGFIELSKPMLLTAANLTQFGGGAKIAPSACPDDGILELVVAEKADSPKIAANALRLFDGSIGQIPEVMTYRFSSLKVKRNNDAPIQVDGELVECGKDIEIKVLPKALKVLVPQK